MWLALIVTIIVAGERETYPECSLASDQEIARLGRDGALSSARALYVAGSGDAIARLARSKQLRGLHSLHVCTDDAGVQALARSPHLGALEELTITAWGDHLDAKSVKRVVTSPALRKNLRRLRFVASDSEAEKTLDEAGFLAIAEHLALPKLRRLDVSWHYGVSQAAVEALEQAPWAAQLEALVVCRTHDGNDTCPD